MDDASQHDNDVSELLARGQPEMAFRNLVATHASDVFRRISRIVGAEFAEDVLQETLIAAYHFMISPRGRQVDNWRAWLHTAAHRRAIDVTRRWERRRALELEGITVPSPESSPPSDSIEIDHAIKDALTSSLHSLKPLHRTQLLMRFADGLTYEEIGKEHGEPPDTVRVRLARTLAHLRKLLQEKGVAP